MRSRETVELLLEFAENRCRANIYTVGTVFFNFMRGRLSRELVSIIKADRETEK